MNRRSGTGRRSSGFTLTEVLVTIALISIVLPVVLQGASITGRMASNAKKQSEAIGLAESKLNEIVVTKGWQSGLTAGDFGADWPGYQWKCQVQNWTDQELLDNGANNVASELEMIVSWQTSNGERSVSINTLVYTPGSTPTTPSASSGSSTLSN